MITLPFDTVVESEIETEKVARSFAENLSGGDLILLTGNLGSGKTFFVKCVCASFQVNKVTSPSFAIVNEYVGTKTVYHFDFYRIKNISELYDIGIDDYLKNEEAIIFVEWADLWREIIPHHHYEVAINFVDENKREIKISRHE